MSSPKIGDLVFIRGSRVLLNIPLIIADIYTDSNCDHYIVLDPLTGIRYGYQLHDLSDRPQ